MHRDPVPETAPVAGPPPEVPKNRKRNVLSLLGLALALAFGIYLVWGFVAPAEDPETPPVAADGEFPTPE